MTKERCGHTAYSPNSMGGPFVCELAHGHKGLHAQHTRLRDRTETTNWGDDGLAPWATRGRQTSDGWRRWQ